MSHKKAQKARKMFFHAMKSFVIFVLFCGYAKAEDGYRLWLRYDPLPSPLINQYRDRIKSIAVHGESATFDSIRRELSEGCAGLLGRPVPVTDKGDVRKVFGFEPIEM